jgi:outer membrane biosynthesis protein TonB
MAPKKKKKVQRPAPKKKAVKKAAPRAKKTAVKKAKKAPVKKAAARSAKPARKPAAAEAAVLPWRQPVAGETWIGVVEDYFSHVGVIATTLKAALAVGDKLHVRGHTTDMAETVDSLQIEHAPVAAAAAGDSVGIKVIGKCRAGDYIYKAGA